jgi:hypothetical protein
MLSSREQVAAIALAVERRDPRQQPFFGRRVPLDDAVLEDMADGKKPRRARLRDTSRQR